MFTNLRLKNFKAWGEQLWESGIELAPITLLLGVNSAGKSSLLQPLRLWQQTVASSDPEMELNLGNTEADGLHLGTFQDTVHLHHASSLLGVAVSVQRGITASAEVLYKLNTEKRIVVESLRIARGSHDTWAASRQRRGGYTLDWPGAPEGRDHSTRAFEPQRSLFLPPEAVMEFGATQRAFAEATNLVARQVRTLSYLGPLRAPPKRFEQWNQQRPGSLGQDGRLAIQALLASATKGERDELVAKVGAWMREIGLVESLDVHQIGNSPLHEVRVTRNGVTSNILDVGFGVSQVLPVVTLAYFLPKGTTAILEEPEMHLHPLAQANLGDLFVKAASERNTQFLIETHSEHLFRRLQFLVASGAVEPHAVRLYFIERDEAGEAVVRHLEMDKFGRIKNWPKHFFGDAVGETERQMRSMIERMKAERLNAGDKTDG
jgi:predicted ATPase